MKNYITVWNYDIFVEIMLYHFYESFEEIAQEYSNAKHANIQNRFANTCTCISKHVVSFMSHH